jgi:Domain of unknown function (DUF3291)
MTRHHIAQLNTAHMRAALDTPVMAGFAQQLDAINALADAHPGFIWRLTGEDPNDPAIRSLGENRLINISVWRDIASLSDYAYRSEHAAALRRRSEWFFTQPQASLVLWWVKAGSIPSIGESVGRLMHLRAHGPSAHAFSFRDQFPPGETL